MRKNTVFFLLSIFVFISCKTSEREKKIDRLEIVEHYYKALDNSDGAALDTLLTDSLLTKEMDYDYEQRFSKKEYIENWLKWDSVFDPTYEILEIEQENETVRAKISKVDTRILLLHEEPTVWHAIIRFEADKIISIENSNVIFNDKTWERNRTELLNWIDNNHPELNEFIHDQTELGGMNYLKAIDLYKSKK